jgi:1H-pyrrole-2-carbonyl-[peptidyl-carrier protein] chlorinase
MNDVIIIGGGPAGATMGCMLSKAGIQNIILESGNHPRPHVGESMVMSSVRVFEEIGMLPTLEREGFCRKYGASWHEIAGREAAITFSEFPQEGISQPYTYHVDRGRLDLLMLKHAESLGTTVYQGVQAKQILFDGDRAVGVRVQLADQEIDLMAKMIVDATGRHTLLGRQLNLKKNDPVFDQFAVHAWFEGVQRGQPETADYIHIYFLPVERGWCWQIPITDTITSMGIVSEKEVFRQFRGNPAQYFEHYIGTNTALTEAMSAAVRINDYKSEGDYSYCMDEFVGNGWVLIGDAARFVDPIFSSGVSIALFSAKYASERIVEAFRTGDFGVENFRPYEEKVRAGVGIWYEFIRLYYKLLPLFTHFIRSKTHRMEVLRLLQGEVYDRKDVPVLAAMRKYIETVEKTDNHLFKGKLASISIDDLPLPQDAA